MHLKTFLLLAACVVFLIPAPVIARTEQDKFDGIIQDGAGVVLAYSSSRHCMAALHEGNWQQEEITGLSVDARPSYAQLLADGEVACLWSDKSKTQCLLTMHYGDKAWLRCIFLYARELNNARVLGRADGSLIVTFPGTTVVLVPQGGNPELLEIPDEAFYHPAKKIKEPRYSPIQAVEDEGGRVWLAPYGYDADDLTIRLNPLAGWKDGAFQFPKISGLPRDCPPTAVACMDKNHLWLGLAGKGLFEIDTSSMSALPARVPDAKEFQYVERIFHRGADCYLVTTPHPTTFDEYSEEMIKVQGTATFQINYYYDTTRNPGNLWKYTGNSWKLRAAGLDLHANMFGTAVNRPYLDMPAGFLLGSVGGDPLYVPDNDQQPAIRMDWRRRVSLENAVEFCGTGNDSILGRTSSGDLLKARIDPAPLDTSKLRADTFRVKNKLIQSRDRRLWGIRTSDKFSEWTGEKWVDHDLPAHFRDPLALVTSDNHNRIWLLNWGQDPETAIFDPVTGKWEEFSHYTQALQKQLPRGVLLDLEANYGWSGPDRQRYVQPAFSSDGRIGAITPEGLVVYFDGKSWRKWKHHEIAGDLTFGDPPYFDVGHFFCIPAGGIYLWDGRANWEAIKPPDDAPDSPPERTFLRLPRGFHTDEGSVAQDDLGTLWVTGSKSPLVRTRDDLIVEVFDREEPNPFHQGGNVYEALVDPKGNAFLRTEDFTQDSMYTYVFIRALPAPPQPHVVVEPAGDDAIRLKLTSGSNAAVWYSWKLDHGNWQPLTRDAGILLDKLPEGSHSVQVLAVDEKLQPCPAPVSVKFGVRIDPQQHIANLIYSLGSEDLQNREEAAEGLRRYGKLALGPLHAAREKAGGTVQWWIDTVTQQINDNAEKTGQNQSVK